MFYIVLSWSFHNGTIGQHRNDMSTV